MDTVRPQAQRKDTFDLREDLHPDDGLHLQAHADATAMHYGVDEEEHSILEDDSEQDEGEDVYEEDDMSSTLSIPNESIDFDMVYALHSFAATVEGQANVVKGDSLFLMDDSNSYWWLVRVLKTQEVGYIPAENIETPFERLARLNKHRNIDLALPTQLEQQEGSLIAQERLQNSFSGHVNQSNTSLPGANYRTNNRRNVHFNTVRTHHRYVPALREGEIEEDDEEWDTDGFEDEDSDLASGHMYMDGMDEDDLVGVEIDDGMVWDDGIIEDIQPGPVPGGYPIPDVLQPGSLREQQQQQLLRAQQLQQQELFSQQQQQQQQILQQRRRETELAHQQAEAEKQQQLQRHQQGPAPASNSRDPLIQDASAPQAQGPRRIDPAEITETRKVTATPTIAREIDERPAGRPIFPSVIVEEERKRSREEDSSDESFKRKTKGKDKMPPPVSSATYNKPPQPGKLRKERSSSSNGDSATDDEGNPKKKKNSMFGGLFGRKKDKAKDKQTTSVGSVESVESFAREDSDRPRNEVGVSDGTVSPTTVTAQQQQQAINVSRDTIQIEQAPPATPDRSGTTQVSAHAHLLRQKDQQQQALYLQYLNRSPSSPPEAQPSYGLQSASAVMLSSPSNSGLGPPQPRPRPGSLILSPSVPGDSQANLNVIRVFAGKNLQTEATFKTVLLNASTTSGDLVRQALQRFRLPTEHDGEYYLTVKQVEGGAFAALESDEKPLVVFETLVNETMELPKLNRNSVGSISSISSNLSMHPAIKKLPMNDFTDDSSVKFYLNRKRQGLDDGSSGHGDDDTIKADSSFTSDSDAPLAQKSPNSSSSSVDRFTATSIRYPLQVVIYAEDLPDDMQFHPTTEAIVYKSSLPDPISPVLVSPTLRRKIFMMPKNITVAEVTELGLERFGIQDGVVDGGDEVEDKMTKRRSGVRIRYGLTISVDGHEREINPSSKVVDAYTRAPQYRNINPTGANKRRSLDPSLIYGSVEDIRPDDPVFVIRRATSYRNSRRRSSVPLDELALSKLHRESTSSYSSSDIQSIMDDKMKRHEIIAAQRAAIRATQRAIISAQTNSVRGMDVLLPGNAMLRSSRFDTNERMRYSYVEPDGETYDISDIIEEEWRDIDSDKDLLEGVFIRNKDGIGERLDRFINKIRKGKQRERDYTSSGLDARSSTARSISPSEYSVTTETSRSVTPGSAGFISKIPNGDDQTNQYPDGKTTPRPGTVTPTASLRPNPVNHSRRHPSISSVISDYSGRSTPPVSLAPVDEEKPTAPHHVYLPKDDFGLSQMMSLIEFRATKTRAKEPPPPHPVDEILFGVPIDLESLHPDIREIYAPAFKQLEEMDKVLDGYFPRSLVGAF